jgi:hypothetical protein
MRFGSRPTAELRLTDSLCNSGSGKKRAGLTARAHTCPGGLSERSVEEAEAKKETRETTREARTRWIFRAVGSHEFAAHRSPGRRRESIG